MLNIDYQLKSDRRREPFVPQTTLPFGQLRSDHMFLMNWSGEITPQGPQGEWSNPRIVPYGAFPIMPGATVLNYGQGCFEGFKAFLHPNNKIYLFRPDKNAKRLNHSAQAQVLPQIPEQDQIQATTALVQVEQLWYPQQEGACFYGRPILFGTEDSLGVHPSKTATYCIFLSPSGPYFEGFSSIDLLVSQDFHRVAPGGLGTTKAISNYAGSLRVAQFAARYGAKQVLYISVDGKQVEEAGAMNHFHVLDDKTIVIPEFTDTILKSITSESFIELSERGILKRPVIQQRVALDEFIDGIRTGRIKEAGCLGTAAVVAPVGQYWVKENGSPEYTALPVDSGRPGPIATEMYNLLTGIQRGTMKAPEGWLVRAN